MFLKADLTVESNLYIKKNQKLSIEQNAMSECKKNFYNRLSNFMYIII